MTSEERLSWISCYEALSNAIIPFSMRRLELIDILADALNESVLNFPIVESGEALEDMCPFTFFAGFNRQISPTRRRQFLENLFKKFDIDKQVPSNFDGIPIVQNTEARFFSSEKGRGAGETALLWELFAVALDYADDPYASLTVRKKSVHNRSNDRKTSGSPSDASCRKRFARAYDAVIHHRVKGKDEITTALFWIRPRTFVPLNGHTQAFLAKHFALEEALNKKPLDGERYLNLLDQVHVTLSNHAFGSEVTDLALFAEKAWEESKPPTPTFDEKKTDRMISDYICDIALVRPEGAFKWRAVRCFQDNWNMGAEDFSGMLTRALAKHGNLLFTSFFFNPIKEILHFADKESELMRQAFSELYDESRPLIARVLRFEETTARLFEQYRGDFVRSIGKRSSHGNFYAISVYLFLRYPDTYYLFSPNRLKGLSKSTRYKRSFKLAEPEILEQYFEMCDLLSDILRSDKTLLEVNEKHLDRLEDYPDPEKHLLLEDIANYADLYWKSHQEVTCSKEVTFDTFAVPH